MVGFRGYILTVTWWSIYQGYFCANGDWEDLQDRPAWIIGSSRHKYFTQIGLVEHLSGYILVATTRCAHFST
jgi:hypothetical protein